MKVQMPILSITLVITFLCPWMTGGHPDGAPEETCDSLMPEHHENKQDLNSPLIAPLLSDPFYRISVNQTSVAPGDVVEVTIGANEGYFFEGYLIQARDVKEVKENGVVQKYGIFTPPNTDAHTLCNNQGLTHSLHKHFTTVNMLWKAPDTDIKDVRFTATVVRNYGRYFMNLHSAVLNPTSSSGASVPCLAVVLLCSMWSFMYSF